MAVREIVMFPHPALRNQSRDVDVVDEGVRRIVTDLKDTLYATTEIGLSAPQINHNINIIIFDAYRRPGERTAKVLINPEVVRREGGVVSPNEGCKSLPWIRVDVPRSARVLVRGLNLDGEMEELDVDGLEAIVVQHEVDHLRGRLIIDYVEDRREDYVWYATNLAKISRLLNPLRGLSNGIIHEQRTSLNHATIIKDNDQIQMYFSSPHDVRGNRSLSGIMSRISVDAPLVLLGTYTQAMMLTLAWKESPSRVYVLGFGGGRMGMLFHHYFPALVVEGTDMDGTVIELSKKFFGIEVDDRMRVFCEDGRSFLEEREGSGPYDIIVVDCFTGVGLHPFRLSTVEFYQTCKEHLLEGGVVATNLIESDPLFREKAATFAHSFGLVYDFQVEGAHVFFGSDSAVLSRGEIASRVRRLVERYGFEFPLEEHAEILQRVDREDFRDSISVLKDSMAHAAGEALVPRGDPIFQRVKRNDPCPCGSGQKFKKCHGRRN